MTACDTHRERLSAEIDGELVPASVKEGRVATAAAHEHLLSCADCSEWLAAVVRLHRAVRVAPADPGPGLSRAQMDHALTHLRPRKVLPGRLCARLTLGVVGAAQTVLGALSVAAPATDVGMAGMTAMTGPGDVAGTLHMSHEYAAWNLALGVAFVVGAIWTRHLAGMLPALAGFVGVLAVLSGIDLAHGDVNAARVVSHALVVAGLVLVALIALTGSSRPRRSPLARARDRAATLAARGSAGRISPIRSVTPGVLARDGEAA